MAGSIRHFHWYHLLRFGYYCEVLICKQHLRKLTRKEQLIESNLCFQLNAATSLVFYIARTFDIFYGLRALVIKTILSVFVDANEIRRTFSIISALEAITLYSLSKAYTVIYARTKETWPAAYYFVTILVLIVCACCFM